MKRLFLVLCVVVGLTGALLAADQDKPAMTGQGNMQEEKMEKMHGMGDKMMMHHMMMMGMMMMMSHKTMLPIKDGFVVMMDGKIMKYDNNLNLVKEVEIKMDMNEMKMKMKDMMDMMKQMPMGEENETK